MTRLDIKAMQEKMRQRCMSGGGGLGRRFSGRRPEKTNSPTFAYQTVYGKNPSGFLPGRSGAPTKTWKGIEVDKGLKNEWLNRLNDLSVEIRSTEEGKGSVRPAAVVFRLPEKYDNLHKKIVSDLRKRPGLYAKSDVGMAGRPRICVAGKIWKGEKDWEKWWEKLPGEIEGSYQRVIEKTAAKSTIYGAFIDELRKIGKAWEPGQQGLISAELPKEAPKSKQPTIAIHGPKGGVQFTRSMSKALQANRAGKKVVWGG